MKFVVLNSIHSLDIRNLVSDIIDIGNYLQIQGPRARDKSKLDLNQRFHLYIETISTSTDTYYLTRRMTIFLPSTLEDNAWISAA